VNAARHEAIDRCQAAVFGLPQRGAVLVIRLYRALLSPLLGANCRFAPTCSQYAEQAIARHGFLRGTRMAGRRLLRCHPWSAGGWDPVA